MFQFFPFAFSPNICSMIGLARNSSWAFLLFAISSLSQFSRVVGCLHQHRMAKIVFWLFGRSVRSLYALSNRKVMAELFTFYPNFDQKFLRYHDIIWNLRTFLRLLFPVNSLLSVERGMHLFHIVFSVSPLLISSGWGGVTGIFKTFAHLSYILS